jgi:hypothetical protein
MKYRALALLVLVVPLVVMAAMPLQGIPDFGNITPQEAVVWLIGAIYGVLQVFVPRVSIFEAIKKLFNLKDVYAHIAVVVMSAILSLAALYLTGELDYAEFTFENVVAFFSALYTLSQIAYQRLKDKRAKEAAVISEELEKMDIPG